MSFEVGVKCGVPTVHEQLTDIHIRTRIAILHTLGLVRPIARERVPGAGGWTMCGVWSRLPTLLCGEFG